MEKTERGRKTETTRGNKKMREHRVWRQHLQPTNRILNVRIVTTQRHTHTQSVLVAQHNIKCFDIEMLEYLTMLFVIRNLYRLNVLTQIFWLGCRAAECVLCMPARIPLQMKWVIIIVVMLCRQQQIIKYFMYPAPLVWIVVFEFMRYVLGWQWMLQRIWQWCGLYVRICLTLTYPCQQHHNVIGIIDSYIAPCDKCRQAMATAEATTLQHRKNCPFFILNYLDSILLMLPIENSFI